MSAKGFRSRLRHLLRRRYLLPILAFGGPLVAISFVQYRWLEELRTRSKTIELQQNHEAAVSAVLLLEDKMSGPRLNTLPAVVHADVLDLRLDILARQFDDGLQRFPYVERFFAWVPPTPPRESIFYFPEEGGFRRAPELVDRMPTEVWQIYGGTERWAEFASLPGDPPYQIVVHRLLDDNDLTLEGIVAFVVNLETFGRSYLPSFYTETMVPMLREVVGNESTPVAFYDENGKCLFSSGGNAVDFPPDSSVEFEVSFATPAEGAGTRQAPRWYLSVGQADSGGVEELQRRGAFANLAIVGAGILVLTLGTVLIARTSSREAQLSDLKSRFISGISHELKTPLSLIRLYSEMLELDRVPDEVERKRFYRHLRHQAEALGDMLEQILDFSRLKAEQQVLRKESCPAKDIIEDAVEMLMASSPDRRVSLLVEGDLPELTCDRHGLVRVFYNLLENAAKYSAPDRPINVHAASRDGALTVDITDQGTGISAQELPHIFERFYRGESSQGVKGTGLGLSIADMVVKAHRGRIEVESKAGEGSRFTVILPTSSSGGRT